jgi:hypothetical protein
MLPKVGCPRDPPKPGLMTALFSSDAIDGAARAGKLRLAHATVETPVFMPVGTQASVKTLIC